MTKNIFSFGFFGIMKRGEMEKNCSVFGDIPLLDGFENFSPMIF